MLQRCLIAKCCTDQINQFYPEMKDINALCKDQSQIKRQLQPAAENIRLASGDSLLWVSGVDMGCSLRLFVFICQVDMNAGGILLGAARSCKSA
jgi:hypothetical protein